MQRVGGGQGLVLTFRKAICQCEMSKHEIIISLCIIKGCIDELSDWPSKEAVRPYSHTAMGWSLSHLTPW